MTYLDGPIAQLTAELDDCEPELIQLYALLAFTKGQHTTLRDVHDAWALWRIQSHPSHRAAIPFEELAPETQELDRPYMEAIHRAAVLKALQAE